MRSICRAANRSLRRSLLKKGIRASLVAAVSATLITLHRNANALIFTPVLNVRGILLATLVHKRKAVGYEGVTLMRCPPAGAMNPQLPKTVQNG